MTTEYQVWRFGSIESKLSNAIKFFPLQLTVRIGSQTKLCAVTLALFETLLALNCEDVMLWLVLRHLIPLRHLLPSQVTH